MTFYKTHKTHPTEIDFVGIQVRNTNHDIRDCLIVLEPNCSSYLYLLTRSEMKETFLTSVIKGEGGTLFIDRGRVLMSLEDIDMLDAKSSKNPQDANGRIYGKYDKGIAMKPHRSGRFPSNLILKHGPTCVCKGTKKVKSSNADLSNKSINYNTFKGGWSLEDQQKKGIVGYADENGEEEVPNWVCDDRCPVPSMDVQSGISISSGGINSELSGIHQGNPIEGHLSLNAGGVGDEGGASRFFKQVQSEGELNLYLESLVRGS